MPIPQNAKTIYDFLRSHGYSGNAAAGITGNVEQESGGNPEAGGPGNAGIIQWTPGSKAAPKQPIMTGNPSQDLRAQLTDLLTYDDQQGRANLQALNRASSPARAALIYSQMFERPLASAANNPNRVASAQAVARAARTGNWKSSTSGSLGTGGGGGGGGGGSYQSARLTSFFSAGNAALKDTGSLVHGTAVVLDRVFGLFAPGNGWRAVFFAVAGLAGYGAYQAWITDTGDETGHLPLAIGLTGVTVAALFFAMRPWPQTAAGPVKPGAYVADTLQGMPPPAGPSTVSPGEVRLTEAGLGTLLTLWAAGKAARTAASLGQAAGSLGGALGKLWGWLKGAGQDLGTSAEGA